MEKFDFKKVYKDLYAAKNVPNVVEVPEMVFISVKGKGAPASNSYVEAIGILYGLTYSIKMSKMNNNEPDGYFEYSVPPLEGTYRDDTIGFDLEDKNTYHWNLTIRQPEFVTEEVFKWAKEILRKKKPELDVDKALYIKYTEGKCVQMMHHGSYDDEHKSFTLMEEFMNENKLLRSDIHEHREIYMNDPRRTKPDKLKTILRIKVK